MCRLINLSEIPLTVQAFETGSRRLPGSFLGPLAAAARHRLPASLRFRGA